LLDLCGYLPHLFGRRIRTDRLLQIQVAAQPYARPGFDLLSCSQNHAWSHRPVLAAEVLPVGRKRGCRK
jgi:hypothetical protein